MKIERSVHFKTEKEKFDLKIIKQKHKKEMIKAGLDPKKRMNLSDPSKIKS